MQRNEKLDWEGLQYYASLMKDDWNSALVSKYEDGWKLIHSGLMSFEHTSRALTLKTLSMIGHHIPRTLNNLNQKISLATLLTTMVTSEENPINRCLASQSLGLFVPIMMERDVPSWIRKNAFEAVLGEFLSYFPKNLTKSLADHPDQFDVRTIITSRVFQARIQMLHAISRFFSVPEAQEEQFLHYIDILFSTILKSHAHHIIQSTVLQVLYHNLEMTNRNRIRVDMFFRAPVIEILSKLQAKNEEKDSQDQSTSESKSSLSCLEITIHKFLSKWYPRPSDTNLVTAKFDDKGHFSTGYASRRRQQLLESVDNPTSLKSEDILQLLDKHTDLPYHFPSVANLEPCYFIKRRSALLNENGGTGFHPSLPSIEDIQTSSLSFKSSLAIKAPPKVLELAAIASGATLFLENSSPTDDVAFCIQIFPSPYFSVVPSVGVVQRGTSLPLKVQFSSRPFGPQRSNEIKGYLRVRADGGFPLERVYLSAYNSPAIKVSPAEIHFGICPPNEERNMVFTITNLLNTHCTVVTVLNASSTEAGSAFHVSQSQYILRGYETRTFAISVYPDEAQNRETLFDELYVVANGRDLIRIPLSAQVGHSLHVVQRKLDFGPTDIFFNAAEKRIHLINKGSKHPLPVYFESSSNEIIVNRGEPVVLSPGEERAIMVQFIGAFGGTRQERLTIYAPNSPEIQVDVATFCGPMLQVPLQEEAFFASVPLGSSTTMEIPFTNMSTANIHFVVTVPTASPIKLAMKDVSYANRDLESSKITLEAKAYETNDLRGLLINGSPRSTAIIELECRPTFVGNLRIPLVTLMMKPKKLEIARHVLNVVVLNDSTLTVPETLGNVRSFLSKPQMHPFTSFKLNAATDLSKSSTKLCHSTVFQLYPPTGIISGPLSPNRPPESFDCISLINISHEAQKYRIALSSHFVTDTSLDGEIPPSSSLDIPIRVNPNLFMTPETKSHTIYGSITILDFDYNSPGMVSSQLVGVIGDIVSLDVRDNFREIKFPALNLMETFSRHLFVRNKSGLRIPWDGLLSTLDFDTIKKTGLSSAALQIKDTWQPFSLSHGKISLKPFENLVIEITCSSSTAGDFSSSLVMSYEKPLDDLLGLAKKIPMQMLLGPWTLRCSIGQTMASHSPEFLNFGDVPIGSASELVLGLTNGENNHAFTALAAPSSLSASKERFLIRANMKEDIVMVFCPLRTGYLSNIVSFNVGGLTHSVPLIGYGGIMQVASNISVPDIVKVNDLESRRRSPPLPQHTIDFGIVSPILPKNRVFEIKNTGTMDLVIHNIKAAEDRWISLRLIECHPTSRTYGPELDDYEIDWDEEDTKEIKPPSSASSSRDSSRLSLSRRPNSRLSTTKPPSKGFSKGVVSNMSKRPIGFPLRVPPNQTIFFDLSLASPDKSGTKQGPFISTLEAEIQHTLKERQILMWWVKACVQSPLEISSKKFELGTCPIGQTQTIQLKITNPGSSALNWKLIDKSAQYIPISRFNPKPLPSKGKFLPSPVSYYPSSGTIKPRTIQLVDISFTPSVAQYDIYSTLNLCTEDISSEMIQVHCTAASSDLVLSDSRVNFGVLRVGTRKEMTFEIHNRGALPASIFLESNNVQFEADPEQTKLTADAKVTVRVKFVPKYVGPTKAVLKIIQTSNLYQQDRFVTLHGTGSYPELVVLSRLVDFGTALFKNPNRRTIKVQNKGAAEATVMFSCLHPDISLEDETGDSGNSIVVGPYTTRDLFVIFTPQEVEKLDVKAFIRSSDTRSDNFMITLKGSVGVPRLTVTPPDALEDLHFGVMRLNKSYKKTFKIANEGNIFLNFKAELEPITLSYLAVDADFDTSTRKPLSSISPPIVIEPSAGTLGVGQETAVTVTFTPNMLLNYEYRFLLNYDFQSTSGVITGTGGRAMLRLDSPNTIFDFGLCRIGRLFKKVVGVFNQGNLGFKFHIRPEPINGDWSIYDQELSNLMTLEAKSRVQTPAAPTTQEQPAEEYEWEKELRQMGIRILETDGYCSPSSRFELHIEFKPDAMAPVSKRFRIYFGDHFETFQVKGSGDHSNLIILDPTSKTKITKESSASLDIGVHPVNSVYSHTFHLVNDGPFPVDFLAQPMSSAEYDIYPSRGFVDSGNTFPLKIFFKPNSESVFHTTFKVLWEGKSVRATITGRGGIGRLEVGYVEDKDKLLKGLDFGMVPFNSACEKRLYLMNYGMVGVYAQLEVDNEEYTITQLSEPIPVEDSKKTRAYPKGVIFTWMSTAKFYVPPNSALDVGARFLARSATTSVGSLTVRSDAGNFVIPLKGKGGTISLSHRGDLDFGDMSCNFTYTRKVTIVNGGSIPSKINARWLVVGQSGEPAPMVKLAESYTPLDPRSGWARQYYIKDKGGTDFHRQLTGKEYWHLLKLMVRKSMIKEETGTRPTGRADRRATASGMNMFPTTALASQPSSMRKVSMAGVSHHFKRRQMFYHLITSRQLSSQSSDRTRPYVKVDPPSGVLPSYGEFVFTVELHLASEDTFLATLIVKSEVPNTKEHEISLTATPKLVNVICDDTRMLNFYKQPLGETEIIQRTFTNVGHKDIHFRFLNANIGLSIAPSKGLLKVGASVQVAFAFRPPDESVQTSEVVFDPIISQPIRFKMYGGGGYAKASLARYRRFDFGHCMIGKDTISYLPIVNEGNAVLHLTRFEIHESDTFFRGQDWPTGRISLFPGTSFNLSMVFNPHEENPRPGRLTVSTSSETYDIELIGAGREAVLIVSKVALEFTECLIGNTYEQRLGLKNVGDVNYPVTFQLEKEFPDIDFYPQSLVINPFSENFVVISYTPTHETKTTVVLTISSPYSTHKVPVMVHSGIASLEFSTTELDFGLFERTTRPSMKLVIRNTGTVRTSFHAKDTNKPSMFQIVPAKGMLLPNKSIEVTVTHIKHEVAQFKEKLIVRTDLVDKFYYISVVGQCEETVLHPEEFAMVNMGICPVLESTTKALVFKNYGRFPLEYTIKSAYPLKVSVPQGRVAGLESGTVHITWNPSGGYELRTQITMVTNIGKFQIVVRGKAMTPEMHVSNTFLDFGVCAVGHSYTEHFLIENKGKVPVYFTIPPCKDGTFRPCLTNGVLAAKETMPIDVVFTPSIVGKFTTSVLVECKGIHYKEVVVAGLGGVMKLDISPQRILLGRCPFDLQVYEAIAIANLGDVTLHVDFSDTEKKQDHLTVSVPDPVVVGPHRTVKVTFGFSAAVVGPISGKIRLRTKEECYMIPVSGTGIRITLSKTSRRVLETEHLPCTEIVQPLRTEAAWNFWDTFMKRFARSFLRDMRIADLISGLLMSDRKIEEVEGEQSGDDATQSVMNTTQSQSRVTVATPGRPHINVIESVDLTSSFQDAEARSSLVEKFSIVSSTADKHDDAILGTTTRATSQVLATPSISARSSISQTVPLPPIGTGSDASTTPMNTSTVDLAGQPISEKLSAVDKSQADLGGTVTRPTTSKPDKRGDILTSLEKLSQEISTSAVDVIDRSIVESALSEFIDIKSREYIPPLSPDDPSVAFILDYGHLSITSISLEELLTDVEPNVEQDLGPLLNRPRPIPKEDGLGGLALKKAMLLQQKRREYNTVFPSLSRKGRNARTDPFSNKTRNSVFGASVNVYPPYHPE